jgi:hypothetical protein
MGAIAAVLGLSELPPPALRLNREAPMTRLGWIGVPALAALLLAAPLQAATPEQEKAFIDTYKAAYAAKDGDTLKGLLYTEGADPMALEFYGEMMTADFGGEITEIALVALTPDDVKEAESVMEGPAGGKFVLKPKPYKKLSLKIHMKDANGESTSTHSTFVAEENGKIVIATPAAVP